MKKKIPTRTQIEEETGRGDPRSCRQLSALKLHIRESVSSRARYHRTRGRLLRGWKFEGKRSGSLPFPSPSCFFHSLFVSPRRALGPPPRVEGSASPAFLQRSRGPVVPASPGARSTTSGCREDEGNAPNTNGKKVNRRGRSRSAEHPRFRFAGRRTFTGRRRGAGGGRDGTGSDDACNGELFSSIELGRLNEIAERCCISYIFAAWTEKNNNWE